MLGKIEGKRRWQQRRRWLDSITDSMVINLSKLQEIVMQETRIKSLGGEDSLKEGMATQSSLLAWRVPWTEEPGGLQSVDFQESERTEAI